MELLSWGVNHKTAGVGLRERLAFGREKLPDALRELGTRGFDERIIISTCNRTEIYTCSGSAGGEVLRDFISGYTGVEATELGRHEYVHRGLGVAEHLFRVTSSLDSMVVGEPEIAGQVKQAYVLAQDEGTVKKVLNGLFQKGFNVAKRIRTETDLSSRPTSVGAVAAALAAQIFGRNGENRILIIGAGDMAEASLNNLSTQLGSCRVTICNRTIQKAEQLAQKFKAQACDLGALDQALVEADIVLCSLGADKPVLTRDMVEAARPRRNGRPVFLIDLGVPRNIDHKVGQLDDVYLYDMDDLQKNADENLQYRKGLVQACEPYIAEGVSEFGRWLDSLENQELISDIVRRNDKLVMEEYARLKGRLGPLGPEQEKEILNLVHRVLNKAMHHPLHSLRNEDEGGRRSAWRRFFFGD